MSDTGIKQLEKLLEKKVTSRIGEIGGHEGNFFGLDIDHPGMKEMILRGER